MTAAQLAAELAQLEQRLRSTKRALKVLQGQQRAAITLLAEFDSEIASLRKRLELKAEEAQDSERFSGTALFV